VAGSAGLQQCGSGWNARPMPGHAQRAEHRRPIYHVLLVGVAARSACTRTCSVARQITGSRQHTTTLVSCCCRWLHQRWEMGHLNRSSSHVRVIQLGLSMCDAGSPKRSSHRAGSARRVGIAATAFAPYESRHEFQSLSGEVL